VTALLTILAFLYGFWALYVLVMGCYRAHLSGRMSKPAYVLALPWVALGYAVDVIAQYTIATVYFADWPRKGEHLVTDRLIRYSAGKGWRKIKADWICTNLLDIFDPRGDHC
jgi:hypothetical protein